MPALEPLEAPRKGVVEECDDVSGVRPGAFATLTLLPAVAALDAEVEVVAARLESCAQMVASACCAAAASGEANNDREEHQHLSMHAVDRPFDM